MFAMNLDEHDHVRTVVGIVLAMGIIFLGVQVRDSAGSIPSQMVVPISSEHSFQ